jgi:hypothetical protein
MTGALDGYLTRDPAQWIGLGRISEAEIAKAYPLMEGEAGAVRGQERRHYRVRTLAWPGFDHTFSLFFGDGRLVILEIDYWSFDEVECARTLEALGPPPHRLDGVFRMSRIGRGEWVYPARGLALCVIPETGLIARWTAFVATTLGDYRKRVRPMEAAREFETETG